jgi:uncharacterized membrane protein
MTSEPADESQGPLSQNQANSGIPAWRRKTEGEQRWWVALSLLAAIALQTALPDRFAAHPRYLLQGIELLAVLMLTVNQPKRLSRRSTRLRLASQAVLGLIAVTNSISVALLLHQITAGGRIPAVQLLLGGAEIWLTNTIVFGGWYWEYDRGGPVSRALGLDSTPDLLFPQMTYEKLDRDWEPIFLDYLYVSYTNSTAFSPTDTMPLSRWAKVLFMIQSGVSLITVALIAARAVNILPNG